MNKYGLHGKLKATEGKGGELASILLHASKLVANAKGCRLYIVGIDYLDKDLVWVTEVWDSKEDHDNSLKAEGVRELIMKALLIIEGQPQKGTEMEILGGWGWNKNQSDEHKIEKPVQS